MAFLLEDSLLGNGTKDINVNIRIIASTSKDLKNEVAIGNFREDLYHRLNVVPIEIPELRSRTEDIPLLIKYFQKRPWMLLEMLL